MAASSAGFEEVWSGEAPALSAGPDPDGPERLCPTLSPSSASDPAAPDLLSQGGAAPMAPDPPTVSLATKGFKLAPRWAQGI